MTHPFRLDPPATRQLIDPERDPVHLGFPQWPRRSQTEHSARRQNTALADRTQRSAPRRTDPPMGARQVVGWPGRGSRQPVPRGPRRPQDIQEAPRRSDHEALRVPEQGDLRSGWAQGHPKPGQIRGQRPAASRTEPGAAGLSGWNEESGPESRVLGQPVLQKRKRTDRSSAEALANDQPLEPRHHDHALSGEWGDHRDCHVKPDLVLICQKSGADTLRLVRLGSHVELGL